MKQTFSLCPTFGTHEYQVTMKIYPTVKNSQSGDKKLMSVLMSMPMSMCNDTKVGIIITVFSITSHRAVAKQYVKLWSTSDLDVCNFNHATTKSHFFELLLHF